MLYMNTYNLQSILPHAGNKNEFGCYEAKIEESEKAGSRWIH